LSVDVTTAPEGRRVVAERDEIEDCECELAALREALLLMGPESDRSP
jgi:hypothetical protein